MKILVTGSGSGLGERLMVELGRQGHEMFSYDHAGGKDVRFPDLAGVSELDCLINNCGVNRIEWLENVTDEDWDTVMDVNAKGIFKMTQACLPMLIKSKGTVLNITSNAATIPMTCSLAYGASKAAAALMTKQLARELTKKYGITVFAIAPNKMHSTGMSVDIEEQVLKTRGWTKEKAAEYQKQSLLTGEETPPRLVAEFIAFLLSSKERHKYLSGCVIPYGA